MKREDIRKLARGELHAIFAEAWFKFLGFVAVTTVFHAAAIKSGHIVLVIFKWACYLLLAMWTNFKIDQAIWTFFPSVDPTSFNTKPRLFPLSVFLSVMLATGVYMLVIILIQVFLELDSGV